MISAIGNHKNDMHCIGARYTRKEKTHCDWIQIQ